MQFRLKDANDEAALAARVLRHRSTLREREIRISGKKYTFPAPKSRTLRSRNTNKIITYIISIPQAGFCEEACLCNTYCIERPEDCKSADLVALSPR